MASEKRFPPENCATYVIKVSKNSPPVTVYADPDPKVASRQAARLLVNLCKHVTGRSADTWAGEDSEEQLLR